VSHADPDALKTDAPPSAVWDIMRNWVKLHPVKETKPRSPAETLLAKEPTMTANFEVHAAANPKSRAKGVTRYPGNPPNWGPKSRARKRAATDTDADADADADADGTSTKQKRARAEERDSGSGEATEAVATTAAAAAVAVAAVSKVE
jgi:tRNA (guanine26-N2/guanine27-N2)-dimethyltransferase